MIATATGLGDCIQLWGGRGSSCDAAVASRGIHSESLLISYRMMPRHETPAFSCFLRVAACAVRASPLRRNPYHWQAAGVARERPYPGCEA
jgi:hypothetical protein